MRKTIISVGLGVLVLWVIIMLTLTDHGTLTTPLTTLRLKYLQKETPSVDHTQFTQLKKHFSKPQEVTSACISCHNERHKEVMKSSHWNWERQEFVEGKGIRTLGKKNILNNFCIGISGNEQSCNRCHIGYGWGNEKFDFKNPLNVDCLSCHDNSNMYAKALEGAGMPDASVNLSNVAQHVGKPMRTNCGTCHFFGGGGNNVKHGDLEEALFDPSRDVDVHMASDGEDMQCVDCHTARKHQMLGKMYSISSMNRDRVECEQCHTALPHTDEILNKHMLKVACQTCHIPEYAKVNSTKLQWDWSTAGKLKNGEPYEEKDSNGIDIYMSIKGSFVWGKNLKPDYIWFNGTASHYLVGDTVNPSVPVQINTLYGSYDDPEAKIVPVKIHRSKQIYDTHYKYLIQPKTVSTKAGDGGFWKEFDWNKASEEGMKMINLPYSGNYGFVETEMTWPVNHMISPKNKTVPCAECHTRNNGRIASLTGFYVPGRDYTAWVETLGTALILITFAGVLIHGGVRIAASRKQKRSST